MADPTEDLFDGLDRPRPLPPALRDRLEARLLHAAGGDAPVPLGPELDERLRTTLTDPVAGVLTGIDGPRPLPAELRGRLHAQLTGSRHRAQRFLGAAAVVVLAVAVAIVVLGPGASHRRTPAVPAAAPEHSPSVGAGAPGAVGAAGGISTGGTGTETGALSERQQVAPSPASAGRGVMADSNTAGIVVSSATPDAGPLGGGTTVTLDGRGFATATQVQFGTADASYQVVSDTQIRAVTPPASSPGRVDVVVRTRAGAMSRLSRGFAYLPRPVVGSLSPATGSASGGTWVDIKGSALSRTTQVEFGDAVATRIVVVSDGEVRALSPAHAPGPVDVTVTTLGGTSASSTGDRYTFLP